MIPARSGNFHRFVKTLAMETLQGWFLKYKFRKVTKMMSPSKGKTTKMKHEFSQPAVVENPPQPPYMTCLILTPKRKRLNHFGE